MIIAVILHVVFSPAPHAAPVSHCSSTKHPETNQCRLPTSDCPARKDDKSSATQSTHSAAADVLGSSLCLQAISAPGIEMPRVQAQMRSPKNSHKFATPPRRGIEGKQGHQVTWIHLSSENTWGYSYIIVSGLMCLKIWCSVSMP